MLVSFSKNRGVRVEFKGIVGGAYGRCRFSGQTGKATGIVVDPLLPSSHQLKTLAHEIAHSMLHEKDAYEGHIAKGVAELEAESVAFVVCDHFGLRTDDYSFMYIASWNQEDAIAQLKTAGARIQKASQEIISFVEAQQDSD